MLSRTNVGRASNIAESGWQSIGDFHIFGIYYTNITQDQSVGSFGANPWFGIWELVTRHHFDGSIHKPEECLTVAEALRSATIWSAYSSFEENKKGSIEPGKLADFLVLDRDPMTIDPEDLINVQCDLVVIDGKEKFAQENCSGILE